MSVGDQLKALQGARTQRPEEDVPAPKSARPDAQTSRLPDVPPPARRAPLPLQGTAKYNDPSFKAVKVYLRLDTRKRAERKWEDTTGSRDLSDLVEKLLTEYLGR